MSAHAYLAFGAISTLMGLLVLWRCRRWRRALLVSGLLAAPGGLTDVWFVPGYWSPPHLFSKYVSVEGVLFSFGHGVLLLFLALVPFGSQVRIDMRGMRIARRYVGCVAIAACVFLPLWMRGLVSGPFPVMDATLAALLVVGIYLLWRRRDAWPLAVSGSLGFSVLYAAELLVAARLAPGFVAYWSPAVRAGPTFAGFPIEELWWAVVYGGVWALSAAYGADIRLGAATADSSVRAQ